MEEEYEEDEYRPRSSMHRELDHIRQVAIDAERMKYVIRRLKKVLKRIEYQAKQLDKLVGRSGS